MNRDLVIALTLLGTIAGAFATIESVRSAELNRQRTEEEIRFFRAFRLALESGRVQIQESPANDESDGLGYVDRQRYFARPTKRNPYRSIDQRRFARIRAGNSI